MGGTEGIIYVNVSEVSECPSKLWSVGFFPLMKPKVFQQHDVARFCISDDSLRGCSDYCFSELNGTLKEFRQTSGDGAQCKVFTSMASRASEM
tara:strand:+ start:384 stop:662 length:279 start_codon:yes stop_codon:yes gene_type:complete